MHIYWQSLNHPDGGKTKTSFFSFVLFTFTIFSASFSGFVFSDALVARHLTMAKGEKLSNTWILPKSNLYFNAEFCWSGLCTFCHSLCTSRTLELCNVHAFMRSSRDKAPWSDKRRTLKRVHDLFNVYSKKIRHFYRKLVSFGAATCSSEYTSCSSQFVLRCSPSYQRTFLCNAHLSDKNIFLQQLESEEESQQRRFAGQIGSFKDVSGNTYDLCWWRFSLLAQLRSQILDSLFCTQIALEVCEAKNSVRFQSSLLFCQLLRVPSPFSDRTLRLINLQHFSSTSS